MLYPMMSGEVLAAQERKTQCIGGGEPVPFNESTGEFEALLAKETVPEATPVACGVNATVNCTLLPTVSVFLAMSLTASAGSIDQFKNAVTGVSKDGTASGSFSFNSKTDQFSNISVSIVSSVFGKINVSDPHSGRGTYKGQGWWEYT
jgi:hypothetical protein